MSFVLSFAAELIIVGAGVVSTVCFDIYAQLLIATKTSHELSSPSFSRLFNVLAQHVCRK